MEKFISLLKEGQLDEAQALLKKTSDEEQQKVLTYFAELVKEGNGKPLQIAPKTVSILRRTLKPDKTYDDFVQAWRPSQLDDDSYYYDVPVQVVNACNLQKPEEVVSIGLVAADEQQLMKTAQKYQEQDAARRKKIAQVAEGEMIGLYKVLDIITLGK